MNSSNNIKFLLILIVLLTGSLIVSVLFGAVSFSYKDFLTAIYYPTSKQAYIISTIRIPRTFAAIFAGIGLATSGSIIQMIFNNPLASPNIIGVNAGASFFVILSSLIFPSMYFVLPIASFLGAFLTAGLIFLLGQKTGFSKTSLILAGLAVNSLFNSATDMICNLNDSFIINNKTFRMGSLSGININVLIIASVTIIIAVLITIFLHNELEVLSLGFETATTLGLPVAKYRILFLMLAAVLAGATISFSGPISFVGLIIPHITKILGITETRYGIIISAVMGALLVNICDLIARMLFRPHEIPVGIILSFLGVPFFLWLLIQRKGGKKYA